MKSDYLVIVFTLASNYFFMESLKQCTIKNVKGYYEDKMYPITRNDEDLCGVESNGEFHSCTYYKCDCGQEFINTWEIDQHIGPQNKSGFSIIQINSFEELGEFFRKLMER